MKTLPPCPPAPFRLCVLICLCALTALTLLTGFPSSPAQAADLSVSGDPGGWGADNTGAAGADGAPKNVVETGAAYGSVTVSGGDGGNGGGGDTPNRGGSGGKGGNASLELSGSDVSVDVLTIEGGNGGKLGWGDNGGSGDDGGNAEVRAHNLSVNTRFSMSSGKYGDNPGGDAIFAADTLTAKSIALTQNNDSSLSFNLGKLVWSGEGAFDVTQNSGGASITIGSLTIDGGTVNSNNYDNLIAPTDFSYTQSDITLGDNGATFDTTNGGQTVGRTLTGKGGLTKVGTGTLELTGENTYTGGTTISAGTLEIGNGGITGSIAGDITNNAALAFNRSDALTYGGIISGTGSLTKEGAGTLTLTGTNTYTGGTTITDGTLKGNIAANTALSIALGAKYDGAGKARSLSALNGEGNVLNTNGLIVQSGTYGGVIDSSNTGGLTKAGTGTLELTGTNTYTGSTIIKAGTLKGSIARNTALSIAAGATYDGANNTRVLSALNGEGTIRNTYSLTVQSGTFGGVIDSSNGSLKKQGVGTLTLTGENTYTGGTIIEGGTLQIGDGGTSGSVKGLIENHSSLIFNRSDNLSHDGIISGTGTLTKEGTGTLTLTGANAYTGTTTIQGGTLALSGGGTLGASTLLDLRGGGLDISGIAPASLSLPDMDVRGPARLNIGAKTADFSGKTLSFYVPSTMSAGGTLLSVGGAGTTDISNSTVRVGIEGTSSPLGAGDAVTLIDATDGRLDGDPANTASKGEGMQGVTLRYAFDVARIGNRLTATVADEPRADSGAKALSEGWQSGTALAAMGADLAAGPGLDNARRAANTAEGSGGPWSLASFGAFSGGVSRFHTGSHVDVSGVSALAGLARRFDAAPGSFLAGAFFEYGYGQSSTHNGFDDRPSVDGSGRSSYYGGGLLARFDLSASPLAGLYAEGSFRFGRLSTDWHSDDLRDALGRRADYDTSVPYYGAHVGLGCIGNLSERASLDVYGKYFRTRLEGDSVRLSTGDPVDFKATDSQRLRAGARLTMALSENVAPWLGAAWEHEFDGKARTTVYGQDVPAPSLTGDSGVFELGVSLKPNAGSAFSFDLAAQGYVGVRQGVSGSVQMKWEF